MIRVNCRVVILVKVCCGYCVDIVDFAFLVVLFVGFYIAPNYESIKAVYTD